MSEYIANSRVAGARNGIKIHKMDISDITTKTLSLSSSDTTRYNLPKEHIGNYFPRSLKTQSSNWSLKPI